MAIARQRRDFDSYGSGGGGGGGNIGSHSHAARLFLVFLVARQPAMLAAILWNSEVKLYASLAQRDDFLSS